MKIDSNQVKTGLYIGAAVVGLFLVYKILKKAGEFTGILDTPEQEAAKAKAEQAVKDFTKQAQKTSKPTRTAAQWQFVADDIYNALKSSAVSDNKPRAYSLLAGVLTDADMGLLLTAFGNRQEYSFGVPIGPTKNLVSFVSDNFSESDISDLNKLYAKSKMRFKF